MDSNEDVGAKTNNGAGQGDGERPLLDVAGLSRTFGDLAPLDDVLFDVARGSRVGLIGPSGSGKLLDIVSGRLSATRR